jgi:hypothetical protein
VLPLFEEHDVKLLRVLTDRGSEYCGNPERHEYELYLAVEDVDHSRTKLCLRYAWMVLVSTPLLASLNPQEWRRPGLASVAIFRPAFIGVFER